MSKIRVGVLGSSGYMSGELVRVLIEHPHISISWCVSRESFLFSDVHPNFLPNIKVASSYDALNFDVDVVVSALPPEETAKWAKVFISKKIKFIDLGATFRLKDVDIWEKVYGQKHNASELVTEAVYGLTELHSVQIKSASLIANPGCFSSAMIIGILPALESGFLLADEVFVTGLSGSAGMGAALTRSGHHPVLGDNAVVYNAVDHRHTYEVEQELNAVTSKNNISIHFTPVYIPITRGIVCISSFRIDPAIGRNELIDAYMKKYSDNSFVHVVDSDINIGDEWDYTAYPWVKAVSGTNHCFIGVNVDRERGRAVTVSVLDSLGKGGAHVAVENINLLFGFSPRTGLERLAMFP
ncbi:N-acetyl-gamma-glutamyl-phosphate reductase [Halomonas sp. WWR20]